MDRALNEQVASEADMWQENELSSWKVFWLTYYDRPVVMASYDFPDKRSGPMRRGMDSMAENFEKFNFALVDRYLSVVPRAARSCTAELVESGITIQFEHKGSFPGADVPSDDWIELAREKSSCVVIITVGEVELTEAQQHLRRQIGNKLCRAARVQFLDRRTPDFDFTNSRYRFLGTDGSTALPRPVSAVVSLDSNVLLDLEKAAQGRVSESLRYELQGLISNLRYQDCSAGFAISELCWTGTRGEYRADREASLLATVDAWFNDPTIDGLASESVRAKWQIRLEYYRGRPSRVRSLDIRNTFVAAHYCCLLKLASLMLVIDGFKANQRVQLFAEYCRWANEDLGAIPAAPLQVAFDGLVGSPSDSQYVRKLLKFSKNPLRNIWGAAWDLAILWLSTDHIAAGQGFNPLGLPPFLVTADKGLAEIRSHLFFEGMMQHSHRADDWRGLVAARFVWDDRLTAQGATIREIIANLQASVVGRLEQVESNVLASDDLWREVQRLEGVVVALGGSTSSPAYSETEPDGSWWRQVRNWLR